jgi:hypothetical protein
MKHAVDEALRDEVRAFALRFACEDCAHFDAARSRCLHGYTERPRVTDLDRGLVVFCKEFELA